jgi:hypothetical protein
MHVLTLRGYNLVVVCSKLHALAGPSIEVSLHVDTTTSALVLADRPILLKGPGTINGWLIGAGALCNLVGAAIAGHSTLVLGVGGRVVCAEVLNNVVLNQAISGDMVSKCLRKGYEHRKTPLERLLQLLLKEVLVSVGIGNLRVPGPTVHGKVGVAVVLVGTGVGDGAVQKR